MKHYKSYISNDRYLVCIYKCECAEIVVEHVIVVSKDLKGRRGFTTLEDCRWRQVLNER